MVIDTSALVAILRDEPERLALLESIDSAERCFISAGTLLEALMVLEARVGPEAATGLDLFLAKAEIEVVSVDEGQTRAAFSAFRRFGKGRHPAKLDYGDCFAYALAETRGERLLFIGDDFARTGLTPP